MWTVRRIIVAVAASLAIAGAVALWPNVEAILTVGAFVGVIAAYTVAGDLAQRRRRRGEEAGTGNAEGAEAIAFMGPPSM